MEAEAQSNDCIAQGVLNIFLHMLNIYIYIYICIFYYVLGLAVFPPLLSDDDHTIHTPSKR